MLIKRFLLLTIPAFLSIFISCSESPTDIGSKLLDSDFIDVVEINSLDNSISQTSSSVKEIVQFGTAEKLLVGKSHNVTASSLINFRMVISDSSLLADFREDRINIISSTVNLLNIYEIGDTNAVPGFNVYKINEGWSSLSFTVDSLPISHEGMNIANNVVITDSTSSFQLDNSVVLGWIKDNEDSLINDDYGIFIEPSQDANTIVGFQANSINADTTQVPHIIVVYERSGSIDTAKFYSFEDVSVVEGDIPGDDNETIYVQGGLSSSAKVWFDLSVIPQNSVINFAELTLTLDTTKTVVGTSYSNILSVMMILDSTRTDSVSSGFTMNRSGAKFVGNITNIIQAIYNRQQNYGLLVSTINRTEGVELFAIKNSNAADTAVRPYLKITYVNKR